MNLIQINSKIKLLRVITSDMSSWNMEQLQSQMDNWKRVKREYTRTQNEWKREDFQKYMGEVGVKMYEICRLKREEMGDKRPWDSWNITTELEPRYQQMIKGFSPAYLECVEWYIGPTLLDNPDFFYPYYSWESDLPRWRRSLWIVHLITLDDYL